MAGKATIPIIFDGGLDTKTNDQLVASGSFLRLENAVRKKTKRIDKRPGFAALGNAIFGSSDTITSGKKIDTFIDDLLLINNDKLYSYASASREWADRGQVVSILVDSSAIIRNSQKQAMPDSIESNGLTAAVWEDSRGGIRCSVFNDETGAAILPDTLVSGSGKRPKVVATQFYFHITYVDGNDWKLRRVLKTSPNVLLTEQTLIGGGIVADAVFDTEQYDARGIFFALNTLTSTTIIGYFDENGVLGAPATNGYPGTEELAYPSELCLEVRSDNVNQRVYVLAYSASDGNVTLTSCTASLLVKIKSNIETIDLIKNVTMTLRADSTLRIYYEQAPISGLVQDHLIRSNTADFNNVSTVVGTPVEFKRSVGLAAKAFTVGDFEYVTAVHDSELQPTYFTIRSNGFIVTRMLLGVAGGLTKDTSFAYKSGLSRVSTDVSGKYTFSVPIRNRVQADNDGTVLASEVGINKLSLAYGTSKFVSDQLGLNYHISGGILLAYDGVSVVEHGFNLYPENIAASATGSGDLSDGTYGVTVTYEWVDGEGQIHRSAPAVPVQVTVTAGEEISLAVPTLRLTEKANDRAPVKIVVYRTIANGTQVFYRDLDINNVPSVDYQTVFLTQSDADLRINEILYTTGNILENIAAPASKVIRKHKNRLFLGGLEDGNAVAYSKYQAFGEGIGFSDGLIIRVDPLGGDVTALASLDDKLIIFKKDRMFVQVGDGPLDTGAQNDFTNPQLISGDVGCDNQDSIVITPNGLMFKSDKGIYLLDRGLNTHYIGDRVEDFNTNSVTSAAILEDANEARFTTSDGPCLVYNYYFDQWSTFTNYSAVSACNALGTYLHLKSDGFVNAEDPTSYLDNGQKIKMAIETSWLAMGGVQGFTRILRWAFLGKFFTNHIARVKLAYNYESVYTETVLFNTQSGLMTTYYGDSTVYGSETPYGGSGSSVWQFRSKPARQKCEAIKFRLEDLDDITSGGGASFALTALTLEVGLKEGINRMGGGKNIGSL